MDRGVVVITGAASGMGLATARRLARPDRKLLLVDVDTDRLARARDDLADVAGGDTVVTALIDVSDADAVKELAAHAASLGDLSILAHAAGISPTMADWRAIFTVDLVGTAVVLDAFLPLAQPGTVAVCWASAAAYMGAVPDGHPAIDAAMDHPLAADLLGRLELANPGLFLSAAGSAAAYGWAKRGVIRLVRRSVAEWGRRGARVVAISPGIIDTAMSRYEYETRPYMRDLVDGSPIPRMGTVGEIAELVAFVTSPEASFLTGTDILIDGGCFASLPALQ